jgi:hypothetical protein
MPGGKVSILGDHIIGHFEQKVYVSHSERFQRYRYFTVQFQIVDKKEILRTVSNTGNCSSSGKVGTVYLVLYISENSVNITALCASCEGVACCSSAQGTLWLHYCNSSISETVRNRKPVHIHCFA